MCALIISAHTALVGVVRKGTQYYITAFLRAAKWQAFIRQRTLTNSSAATHSGLSLCDSYTKWLSISRESVVIFSVAVL